MWRISKDGSLRKLEALLAQRQERVAELEALLAQREERIEQLEAELAQRQEEVARWRQWGAQWEQEKGELNERVAQLEMRLAASRSVRHSGNSHRPPSTDEPGAPKRQSKAPTGRKPGGQPGHEPHARKLVAAEHVNEFKQVEPAGCSRCGGSLQMQQAGQGPEPVRHQVVEVEPMRPHVTEWRLCWGLCAPCQLWTQAQVPPGVPPGGFGPRLTALVGLMTGQLRMSKRLAQQWLEHVLGVELSLGSLSHLEAQVSAALEPVMQQAQAHVHAAALAHADETRWREQAQRVWLWVAVTAQLTLFLIFNHRDKPAAQKLLGESFPGIRVSDRYEAYGWVEPSRRQVCWAHLLRDFQSWVDAGGVGALWGQALLAQAHQLFHLYHRMKEGTLQPTTFQQRVALIRAEVGYLLRRAEACPDS